MSYDVSLVENDKNVRVSPHTEGGTYVVGGSPEAQISITYNYAPFFCKALHEEGLCFLSGKKARDVTELLRKAIASLGVEQDPDYWASTPGNAGHALLILLDWALQYPDAVFEVH